jgi:glycerophosphoryl diester phosphodiesterase
MEAVRRRIAAIFTLLKGRWDTMVVLAVAFGLLSFAIVAPAISGTLALFLRSTGKASVGNFEIASFLLSPAGFAAIIGVGALLIATAWLRVAVFQTALGDRRLTWWQVVLSVARRLPRVLELGLRQAIRLFLLALPFAAAVGAVYLTLWRGRDLNGLIVMKPPVFWWGAVIAVALVAAYAVLAVRLLLRWSLALPALLFEPGVAPARAMSLSVERTRGRLMRTAGAFLLWLGAMLLLATAVFLPLRLLAAVLLGGLGSGLPAILAATALLLGLHAAVAALLDIIGISSFAALFLSLYRDMGGASEAAAHRQTVAVLDPADTPRMKWSGVTVGLILLLLAAWAAQRLLSLPRLSERLEVTAHRAGGGVAPENTIAALERAIRDKADWAEIDVQLTRDGAMVIAHDYDFVRIGGPATKIQDMSLAEVRAVDAGRRFGSQFAGEKVPTLDEMTSAAGTRIRLNIELKPHGAADVEPLTRGVLEAVRHAEMVDRVRLCSQSYDAMQLARRLEPRIATGFIAGAALGDLPRLKVQFLMVNQKMAKRRLTDSAGVQGIAVHAWTINDPAMVAPLLDEGVANIITDNVAAVRGQLDAIRELPPAQRLLLRFRNLLAH